MKSPAFYKSVQGQLKSEFRSLRLFTDNGVVFVRGALPITSNDGTELDRFLIEIELPGDFPKTVPTVRETGGKIPRTPDRHINPDGTACLFVRDEAWKYWNRDTSLIDFIKGPIHQFFLGQIFFSERNTWPFGQRSHFAQGVAEYYFEELNTSNLQVVIQFLKLLRAANVDHRASCYCGSLKRLKDCHILKVLDMRGKITTAVAEGSLEEVQQLARKRLAVYRGRTSLELKVAESVSISQKLERFLVRFPSKAEKKSRPMKTCGPPDITSRC